MFRYNKVLTLVFLLLGTATQVQASDPLSSWSDVASKVAVIDFVEAVTQQGGPDYVVPSERIAVFDNDGTLWSEKPIYFQLLFAIDRVKALAPEHPEWKTTQPQGRT